MTGRYDGLSASQLVHLLEKRDRQKRLGLVWERDEIEADAAVDENFVACELVADLAEGPASWSNLVIEGDNFDALRWLRMTHSGRVDCVYIDPPYNTGNRDWVYNDHFFDASNRYRHSTWLEFMYRRILLARDLLRDDGVMLVSINDENRARLELLLDEAMPGMRVGSFVWRTKDSSNDADRNLSSVHEHVLIYAKPSFSFLGYELTAEKYKGDDGDGRGRYSADPITKAHSYLQRANTYYPIQDPETGWWYPCNPDSVWRFATEARESGKRKLRSETMEALIRDRRIIFPATEYVLYETKEALLEAIRSGTGPADGKNRPLLREDLPDLDFWVGKPIALGRPSRKAYWDEKLEKIKPVSSFILGSKEAPSDDFHDLMSDKQGVATGEIREIFGSRAFDYPKPVSLIRSLLSAAVGSDALIVDFFAGAATTAQAIMELNAEDDGRRRFIMVSSTEATMEEPAKNLCRDITAMRIRKLNAATVEPFDVLEADFAYLRTRKIPFEDLDYDLSLTAAWTAIESLHDLPLTPVDAAATWQKHETPEQTVILVDRYDDGLLDYLRARVCDLPNLTVYAWAPGQVIQQLAELDIEVRSVRDVLVKRAQL